MKILITEAFNLQGDSLLRVMKSETNFDIYLLSGQAKDFYSKDSISLIPNDILDVKSTKKTIYDIKPDVIINSVEYGDLRSAEKDKMQSYNSQAVESLCSISRVLDCQLVALSNEFVFDGKKGPYTEQDKPGANSYYGNTKHAMENACIGNVNNCALVRTSLIYGHNSYGYKTIKSDVIDSLSKKIEYDAGEDFFTNPVFADEFAYAIIKIIEKKRTGIYHVSGKDHIKFSDFLIKLAAQYNLDGSLIKIKNESQLKRFGLVNYKSITDLGLEFSGIDSGLMAMKYYMYGKKLLPL